MSPPATPAIATFTAATPTGPVPNANAEDEDYVWDVFYQRPTKLSEWNAVANIGTLYVHLYHISRQVSDMLVCHRTGLPPLTTDPSDSDSDTEPEDEADEDSNGQ